MTRAFRGHKKYTDTSRGLDLAKVEIESMSANEKVTRL
jgi:hypothetical protein